MLRLLHSPCWDGPDARPAVPTTVPGALLLCLAAHDDGRGAWIDRETLVVRFWPDRPAAEGQRNLRANLHRLRSLLSDWGCAHALVAERTRLRLALPTDLALLAAAAAGADPTGLLAHAPFTGCRATGCRALPSSAPGPTTPAATGNPSGARPAHPRWSRPRVTRQPTSARPCWRPGSRPAVPITRPAMPNPDTSPWTTTSCCPGAVTTRRGCAATARLWWSCWASRASARPACSPAPGPLHRCSRAARGWRACPLRLCWSGCANTRLGWTPPCAPRRPRWAPTAWIWRGCCRKSRATKPCRHWTLKPPRPACSRPWHGSSRAAARCCWSMTCSGSIWPPSNGWCC